MFKKIIFEGQIPYLKQIRIVLLFCALITPLAIFLNPREFGEFGDVGWKMLIAVMMIRPLADLFPKIKLLRTLVVLRKEIGIWSGMMILAHVVGYFMVRGIWIADWIVTAEAWSLKKPMGWGTVSTIALLPVLFTSNRFSILKLKKWWKRVQKLAYLFFFAGGVHVAMLGNQEAWIAIGLVAALVVAAKIKKILFVN